MTEEQKIKEYFKKPNISNYLLMDIKTRTFLRQSASYCKYTKKGNDNFSNKILKHYKLDSLKLSDIFPDFEFGIWNLFTKDGCSSCGKAKDLLRERDIPFSSHGITENNKNKVYSIIDSLTNNYRYFPIIFNNGKFIGGYTELNKIMVNNIIP